MFLRSKIAAIAIVLLTIADRGEAQDGLRHMLGTISAEAKAGFAGGRLNNCYVEFGVLAQDWIYKQGAYIRVAGSFGLMSAKGTVAGVLKVILHDINPKTLTFTPSPPTSAYFVSGNSTTSNAVVDSYPSDVPGAIFVVFRAETVFPLIADGMSKSRVTIAFTRTKGGSDVVVPIDTSVIATDDNGKRTRSPQVLSDFVDCVTPLLKPLQR